MAWNGSDKGERVKGEKVKGEGVKGTTFNFKALLAGIVVVLGGGLVAWFFLRPAADRQPPKTRQRPPATTISEVQPQIVTNASASEKVPVSKAETAKKPKPPATWRNKTMTEEQKAAAYEKALAEQSLPEPASNRVFRTGLEQQLDWVFTTELGDMPPPMPRLPDYDYVHLQEILELKNEVKEGDSAVIADSKQTVDIAKQELKSFVEKGGDPEEFLEFYHDKLQSAYLERKLATEQVMKVMFEEPELSDDYLAKVNDSLAKKGIKPVVISKRMRLGMRRKMEKEANQQE